jgi:hypothetical protein
MDESKKEEENNNNNNVSLVKLDSNKSFLELTKDTDLNKITENWFWKSSLINYFTKWTHKKQSDIFSSLKMAQKYLDQDLIGEIDVITDAEVTYSTLSK